LNLTAKSPENQVSSIDNRLFFRPTRFRTLILLATAVVLTACEPSPASQALAQKQALAANTLDAVLPATDIGPAALATEPTAAAEQPPPAPPTPELPVAPADAPDPVVVIPDDPTLQAVDTDAPEKASFDLLGESVPPGTSQRLMWSASQIFEGVSSETPVLVVNGRGEGPALCLTAAIHGDELNGIEMVRRVLHDLDPDKVSGTIIGIPIVNLQGFRRGSRYLPDRRDLNRFFPGNPQGSSAARIAHSLFASIIERCDALVDLHTGSFYRTNMPQLRADLRYDRIRELTQGFGGIAVLHSEAAVGTLRRAATDAGIPAITLEAGEPMRLQSEKVSQGVTGIFTLLDTLGIISRTKFLSPPETIYYQSTWVRADNGGILFSVVRLGQAIDVGDVLGTVTDPITNQQNLIYSPAKGRVLGMALNQVVQPGFAAFRIGIETDGPPTQSTGGDLAWAGERSLQRNGQNNGNRLGATGTAQSAGDDVEAEESSE
jgi:predicted deacylase